jgi:predicted DCC family thiol-disulfide oxidoreductase YuxK
VPRIIKRVNDLSQIGGRLLVIYDGRCGFCDGAVRWFLRRDRQDHLRFVASEAPLAVGLMRRHGVDPFQTPDGPGSLLVARNVGNPDEEILGRSTAVITLLTELPGAWPAVGLILRLLPLPLRDFAYGVVASNRYRLAGRHSACPLPTAAERRHFL